MNHFIVALKRILARRLYLVLVCLLLLLTILYQLLPEQSKTTDIKVAIYAEEQNEYTDKLQDALITSSSLYHFYYTESPNAVKTDVQSGYAECGFIIPDGFFDSYINGSGSQKISLLESPSSTLSAAISETLFHYIFKLCSPQILIDTFHEPSLNEELQSRMDAYVSGDQIFQMSSLTSGSFNFETQTYHINLPIQEFTCLLLLFAGLFGLMLFMQDRERNIYIALTARKQFGIECSVLSAALLPVLMIGLLASFTVYGSTCILPILVTGTIAFTLPCLLSLIVRKSTTLAKLLPILLFAAILYFFVGYLL